MAHDAGGCRVVRGAYTEAGNQSCRGIAANTAINANANANTSANADAGAARPNRKTGAARVILNRRQRHGHRKPQNHRHASVPVVGVPTPRLGAGRICIE